MTLSCRAFFCGCLVLLNVNSGFAQPDLIATANRLETQGRFSEASLVLRTALSRQDLSVQSRSELEFELDRLRRIQLDFPYTESALFTQLKKSVTGITREEFAAWVREGRFDSRDIDGQRF